MGKGAAAILPTRKGRATRLCPPYDSFRMIAFVVSATAKVDLMKVYKGTSVLMLSIVITTILLMVFPQIALWLPQTMR